MTVMGSTLGVFENYNKAYVEPAIAKTDSKMALSTHQTLHLKGDQRWRMVICHQGVLWVTQENDLEDYVLKPGGCSSMAFPNLAYSHKDELVAVAFGCILEGDIYVQARDYNHDLAYRWEFSPDSPVGDEYAPDVEADKGGGFLTVWHTDLSQSSSTIYGQTFRNAQRLFTPGHEIVAQTQVPLATDSRGGAVQRLHVVMRVRWLLGVVTKRGHRHTVRPVLQNRQRNLRSILRYRPRAGW